jgi:hypothetical protein
MEPAETSPDPLQELRTRCDWLVTRQVIGDMILMTALGTLLRRVDQDVRNEVLSEIRSRIHFGPSMFLGHDQGATLALMAEEAAANVLDAIERFARNGT